MFLKNLFFDKLSGLGKALGLRYSFVSPSCSLRSLFLFLDLVQHPF